MSSTSKTEKSEIVGAGSRRSTRLAIAIPITLSGTDAAGNAFKENTRTIVVNKHGAKIMTAHQIVLGSEVDIENRALGLTARAAVVWVGEKRPQQGSIEAGIQLFNAENIWGIEFPPQDWREGPPVGAGGKKIEMPAQLQADPPPQPAAVPAPQSVTPPPPQLAAPPKTTPPPTPSVANNSKPTAPKPTPALPAQFATELEQLLQRFARQAEGIASHQTRVFQQSLQQLTQQIGLQTESSLRAVAAREEENAENSARALEDHVLALENRLQMMGAQVESQTAGLTELHEAAHAEVGKVQQNIQDASWQALQAATEELSERIQSELETALANFPSEARQRFQQESALAMEAARSAAETQLKAQSEAMAAGFQDSLRGILQEFREKSAEAAGAEVNRIVQERKEALAGEFQERIAAARQSLMVELKSCWKEQADDARRQLMSMAIATAESISSSSTEGLNKFRAELEKNLQNAEDQGSRKLEERLSMLAEQRSRDLITRLEELSSETKEKVIPGLRAQAAETFSRQIEELAAGSLNRVRQAFEDLLQKSRKQMEEATAAHQDQVMREAQAKLALVTERLTEDSAAQLQTLTQENLDMAQAKLLEFSESVVNQAEDAFRARLAEVIAPALKPNDRRSKPRFSPEPAPDKP